MGINFYDADERGQYTSAELALVVVLQLALLNMSHRILYLLTVKYVCLLTARINCSKVFTKIDTLLVLLHTIV